MLSTFLPFYLLPPVTKFRGVFGGKKLFLPGHLGFIFDGRVETPITSRTQRPSATRVANKNTCNRPLDTSTPSTNFLNWMRFRGTMTWMSENRSRKYRVVSVEHGMIATKGLPNSRRRARTRGSSLKGGLVTTHSLRSRTKKF